LKQRQAVYATSNIARSITAFIGRVLQGPVNMSIRIQSIDFAHVFDGLWKNSRVSFAANHLLVLSC
jgi:hypothetical protein